MSRTQAAKHWRGEALIEDMRARSILIRTRSERQILPDAKLTLLYDVSHNTCKIERDTIDGATRELMRQNLAIGQGAVSRSVQSKRGTRRPVRRR